MHVVSLPFSPQRSSIIVHIPARMSSKYHGASFRSRSSDHVPVVPTMVSSGSVGVKRIHVFRNGDVFFQGIQVVINTHRVPSLNILLDVITERIGLINGAKKLYTTNGSIVKDINKIKDGEHYVASSSHFTPMAYGGEIVKKVEKKKKKKRSKTVHSKERKEMEIEIPLNEDLEKKKRKKKVKKELVRHGSVETLAETAEVELPSELDELEDEQEEHEDDESHDLPHHEPPSRAVSRRESRKEMHEEEEKKHEEKKEKRRKSVHRRKSRQPNWGDLSSFTKNIESLLQN